MPPGQLTDDLVEQPLVEQPLPRQRGERQQVFLAGGFLGEVEDRAQGPHRRPGVRRQ
ncbi:hypothetical protein [Streptomyces griseoflavus]|uniref:hypothetical protein n=1 Tax=Streptomyces griseoflavus TaxID=35619 RepID=UPI003297EE97